MPEGRLTIGRRLATCPTKEGKACRTQTTERGLQNISVVLCFGRGLNRFREFPMRTRAGFRPTAKLRARNTCRAFAAALLPTQLPRRYRLLPATRDRPTDPPFQCDTKTRAADR